MATIYSDSFHRGKGHTDGDDVPFALAFQDVGDDLAAVVARSDTTMQAKVDELATQQTAIRTKVDSFIANYTGHIAAAGVHQEADTTNSIDSPVATDVTADILTLLNNEAVKFDDHIINVDGGIHGGVDSTNTLTETIPATNETEAVALGAELYTLYEAHRVLTAGSVHGGADSTNTIASAQPTDWDSLVTFCNEFKNTTGFNAHISLEGGVHGADGAVDAVTADDCGVQKTALELEINEIKTDLNGHIALLGVHPNAGTANSTTAATTEATSVALINGLKATANTHFAAADDHQDADTTSVDGGDTTEYEDVLVLVAEVRAAIVTHIAKSAVHSKADSGNAETVVGSGGDVAVLGTGDAVTLKTINGGTR